MTVTGQTGAKDQKNQWVTTTVVLDKQDDSKPYVAQVESTHTACVCASVRTPVRVSLYMLRGRGIKVIYFPRKEKEYQNSHCPKAAPVSGGALRKSSATAMLFSGPAAQLGGALQPTRTECGTEKSEELPRSGLCRLPGAAEEA